jgi:hypothetical protein
MWNELWTDFNARAARLTAIGADWVNVDAIDTTIIWQLLGRTCYVPTPIPEHTLHLPELYSGAPWGQAGTEPWIAFVTLNPSIDPNDVFPTRQDFYNCQGQQQIDALIAFFNDRFCFPANNMPLRHGRRDDQRLTVWKGNPQQPTPHGQRTWEQIEGALRQCLAGTPWANPATYLGRIAAITDAVPWKFASWGCVPEELQMQLLTAGSAYLHATLHAHPPRAIVTCGSVFNELPDGHVLAGADRVIIGEHHVPCFRFSAPTARPTTAYPLGPFVGQMQQYRDQILLALQH